MLERGLKVGARLVVSTTDGDEVDEVTRVLVDAVDAGLWVVETARNGRVIVMRGGAEDAPSNWRRTRPRPDTIDYGLPGDYI
jgi:hypothetical protein